MAGKLTGKTTVDELNLDVVANYFSKREHSAEK
jgi:hypothetical protein